MAKDRAWGEEQRSTYHRVAVLDSNGLKQEGRLTNVASFSTQPLTRFTEKIKRRMCNAYRVPRMLFTLLCHFCCSRHTSQTVNWPDRRIIRPTQTNTQWWFFGQLYNLRAQQCFRHAYWIRYSVLHRIAINIKSIIDFCLGLPSFTVLLCYSKCVTVALIFLIILHSKY